MAPFAGRLHEGRLVWRGREHRLPLHAAPHAIHGTAVDGAWQVVASTSSTAVLEPPGLFALNYGTATPLVAVGAHVIYGAVLGLFLGSS